MARKKRKGAEEEQQEERKVGRLQWFLFVAVIPTLFAVTIALIVMTIAGVNVFDKASQWADSVPYVSEWLDERQDSKAADEQIAALQAEVKNKEAEIAALTSAADESAQEKEELLTEQDRLKARIAQLEAQQTEEANGETAAEQEDTVNIAETYESMDEEAVSAILVNLTEQEAVTILKQLSVEKQAKVMESLPAETAAAYTKRLSAGP